MAGPSHAALRGTAVSIPQPISPTGPARHFLKGAERWALTSGTGEKIAVSSLLNVNGPMEYGDFVWNDEDVPSGKIWVRVDIGHQMISVFRDGHEIGTSVILYGVDKRSTPAGDFKVLSKARSRWSRAYGAPMPYSLTLTRDGVAIHGSDVRLGFGTHGCIGVPIAFARRIFDAAQVGDVVSILPS